MARFHLASVLRRSAVPSHRGAEAGRHALEGRRNVRSEGFKDCASRFDRPGTQNRLSDVRPMPIAKAARRFDRPGTQNRLSGSRPA
jgi:hypothetical protein